MPSGGRTRGLVVGKRPSNEVEKHLQADEMSKRLRLRIVQPSPPLSLVGSFGGSLPPDADGKDALVIVVPKHWSSAIVHRSGPR
jgi:hypothetical protein